jgi:hypothetical protein
MAAVWMSVLFAVGSTAAIMAGQHGLTANVTLTNASATFAQISNTSVDAHEASDGYNTGAA